MFIITTPIPYTNGQPHLGHLLEGIYNDTLARYFRSVNKDVCFTMGLDQHGLKIYQAAQKDKIDTAKYVEQTGQNFVNLWNEFNVQYDKWIPTHSPNHQAVAQIFWKHLAKKGLIYKKTYEGLYNMYDEAYITEKDLDDNGDLVGRPGTKPLYMQEENYFLALSQYKDKIVDYLDKTNIEPSSVRKELINFITADEGLQDISISREKTKMPWGVAVPGDDGQVMYVWFEAVINYATAVVDQDLIDKWNVATDKDAIELEILACIRDRFPVDIQYIGKDISRFHLIYWPMMLMALNIEPPAQTIVHGHINDKNGRKFSKSLGNGVGPDELMTKFEVDGSRFIILHEVNLFGDTDFDWQQVSEAYNSHLANNLGNLLMRVTTLVNKNLDGVVDLSQAESIFDFTNFDKAMQNYDVRGGLDILLEAGRVGNETLEQTQPWKLLKEGKDSEAKYVLTNLTNLLLEIAKRLKIFVPQTGQGIEAILTADKISKAEVLFGKVDL